MVERSKFPWNYYCCQVSVGTWLEKEKVLASTEYSSLVMAWVLYPKKFNLVMGNTTICQYYKLSEYIFVSEIFVNIPNVILSNVIAKELSKVYDNNLLNPLSLSWTILMSFLTLLSLVKNIFHNVHICNLCFHHEQFLFVFLNYWIDRRIFHNNHICDLWGLCKWFWCFFRLWE